MNPGGAGGVGSRHGRRGNHPGAHAKAGAGTARWRRRGGARGGAGGGGRAGAEQRKLARGVQGRQPERLWDVDAVERGLEQPRRGGELQVQQARELRRLPLRRRKLPVRPVLPPAHGPEPPVRALAPEVEPGGRAGEPRAPGRRFDTPAVPLLHRPVPRERRRAPLRHGAERQRRRRQPLLRRGQDGNACRTRSRALRTCVVDADHTRGVRVHRRCIRQGVLRQRGRTVGLQDDYSERIRLHVVPARRRGPA